MPIIQFKGKTAIESYHRVVPHHTLEIDPKLSLAKKTSLDGNLIIEGDNLIALKSLLPTHAGKIKCIYIDPPYNTGNEGWIYNDNLTQPQFKEWIGKVVGKEGEDSCRHDKWCCMMYPRLQLLKDLLDKDGAIFISIDDNEVHHLRMLMDEVFGEENFRDLIAVSRVKKNIAERERVRALNAGQNYILCYAKNESGTFVIPMREQKKKPRWHSFDVPGIRKTMEYELFGCKPPNGRHWMYGYDGAQELIKNEQLRPNSETGKPEYLLGASDETMLDSNWTDILENGSDWNYPNGEKNVDLIKRILAMASDKNSIILDSFAGSGTTAEAIIDANAEDGGTRRFVLVQQPFDTKENEEQKFNICEKITTERVRRVIKGYSYKTQTGKTEKVEGLGGEFSYVRVGEKLMGEYRDLGDKLPNFEEVARYIFFTETSQGFDASKLDKTTGKIGEWKNTSYYLLYSPSKKEHRALDAAFLENLKDKNPRKVIYCEKVWIHREDLSRFGDIRPMLVPFNLK